MKNSKNNKIAIIGAGPSGLSIGLFLDKSNKVDIFEKEKKVGGHAGTFVYKNFTFDYGPHILFSKDQEILNFLIKSLKKNISICTRNNKISIKNNLIKYPFENDLGSLNIWDNYNCLKDYLFNKYKKKFKNPKNMYEWLYSVFGKSISEMYLIPYNEKVWNLNVKKLSMIWSERIPNPPSQDVIKSSLGISTEGYKHQLYYHYPKKGGYEMISRALSKNQNIYFEKKLIKIVKKEKKWVLFFKDGIIKTYDNIISTIPIQELSKILNYKIPKKIVKDIDKLIVNPLILISIGLKGKDNKKFTAIYFPEKNFLVNRISFPGTFSKYNCPKNTFSIQAEITCRKNSLIYKMSDKIIKKHVLNGLISKKIIKNKKQIIFCHIKKFDKSYVVYDLSYEKSILRIRNYFNKIGITLLGRFSYFEYINVDMAVNRSLEIANKFNIFKKSKTFLLKKAIRKIL